MKTIKIDGEQYPVEGLEGCRRFKMDDGYDVEELYHLDGDGYWRSFAVLNPLEQQSAACVAFAWYTKLAQEVYPFDTDAYGHVIPNPMRKEYQTAANAWYDSIDWRE